MNRGTTGRGFKTDLAYMEMARALSELGKNPDLTSKIKDAYALMEEEEQKLAGARKTIADAEAAKKDIEKHNERASYANDRIAAAEASEAKSSEVLKKIAEEKRSLKEKSDAIVKQIAELENSLAAQDERKANLDSFEEALDLRAQQLDQYKSAIEEAEQKSREAFSGLMKPSVT